MTPAPKKDKKPSAKKGAPKRRAKSKDPKADSPPSSPPSPGPSTEASLPPASVGAPATPTEVATPVPIEANRPNLLDTGLSDYGMWVDIVAQMPHTATGPGERSGRIWA